MSGASQGTHRYRLRPVLPSERALVYQWRNDPRVRRVMSNPRVIDQEVHKDWWPAAISDPSRRMLILDDEGTPAALLLFFDLKPGASAKWGFYMAPSQDSPERSLATWLTVEVAAIAYAFDRLRLETLYCETLETNAAVLLLHGRIGFQDTGSVVGGFIEKSFTRSGYENVREGPLFAQLREVAMGADPRDVQVAIPQTAKPALPSGHRERAAILGSANWELAARDLAETYRNTLGLPLEVTVPPFGQYMLDLADGSSPLRRNPPDILIFAERFEDLASAQGEAAGIDEQVARARFRAYLEAIQTARGMVRSRFLIHNFAPVRPRAQSVAEAVEGLDTAARLAASFNRELLPLAGMADTLLVPVVDQIMEAGRRHSDPGKYWLMGRIPFGQPLVDRWTSCVAGMIAAGAGRTIRAIVCDLDQTLWPGYAGDTGPDAVNLGAVNLSEDWPGNAFLAVQRCLKLFGERGLLLAICSKNDEATALQALRNPGMILAEGDFSARRIDWRPKPENIASIARELGLDESSLMVLDNDPLERGEIREALPSVVTPELPWDVADWPRFLVNHPLLTQLALLPEDAGRRSAYQVRQMVEKAAPRSTREAVLRSLGLAIEWKPVNSSTVARAVQLAAKTNQFNTSAIRYRESDLTGLNGADAKAWTVRLRDRFGGDEIAGLAVMRFDDSRETAVIETILLSCRVLGRGVETAVLALLQEAATDAGCLWLEGAVVETDRNGACRDLYQNHGFEQVSKGRFVRDLALAPIGRPAWFTYL